MEEGGGNGLRRWLVGYRVGSIGLVDYLQRFISISPSLGAQHIIAFCLTFLTTCLIIDRS